MHYDMPAHRHFTRRSARSVVQIFHYFVESSVCLQSRRYTHMRPVVLHFSERGEGSHRLDRGSTSTKALGDLLEY